ncbi:hypothetical protein D9545_16595 [Geobacillus stearothermophilus]|nr:hypothetical protein D9545_16595 [Geobacillus stearothermophilus]
MLVHREHLLGLFVLLLTFYRKGALFSIPFGFYWIINTPESPVITTREMSDVISSFKLRTFIALGEIC